MNSAPWIILFSPLLAAAVIVIATQPFKKLSSYVSVAAVAVSLLFALTVFGSPDQDVSFPDCPPEARIYISLVMAFVWSILFGVVLDRSAPRDMLLAVLQHSLKIS